MLRLGKGREEPHSRDDLTLQTDKRGLKRMTDKGVNINLLKKKKKKKKKTGGCVISDYTINSHNLNRRASPTTNIRGELVIACFQRDDSVNSNISMNQQYFKPELLMSNDYNRRRGMSPVV